MPAYTWLYLHKKVWQECHWDVRSKGIWFPIYWPALWCFLRYAARCWSIPIAFFWTNVESIWINDRRRRKERLTIQSRDVKSERCPAAWIPLLLLDHLKHPKILQVHSAKGDILRYFEINQPIAYSKTLRDGSRKGPLAELGAVSSGRNAPWASNDKAPQKPRDLKIRHFFGSIASDSTNGTQTMRTGC